MIGPVRVLAFAACVLASGSCNHRSSLFESMRASAAPSKLPAPPPGVFSLAFEPAATLRGGVVRGRALLTAAAPEGGLEVSLSSQDPALLSLPSTIVVAAGSDGAEFAATTQAASTDRDLIATAVSPDGRHATAVLSIWALLPTFFSFSSESGDYVGGGSSRRLAPPLATSFAWCSSNEVHFTFSQNDVFWSAVFQAPKGMPIRVGVYEGATRYPFQKDNEPGLDVGGEHRGCLKVTGRFVVHEADFGPTGQVRQFWATFEQHCGGAAPALLGDVRVTGGPAVSGYPSCLR